MKSLLSLIAGRAASFREVRPDVRVVIPALGSLAAQFCRQSVPATLCVCTDRAIRVANWEMQVGRWLPIALFVFVLTVATNAQAEFLTTKGGELFCRDRSNFPEYLAVVHNKQASYHTVEGCRQPAKGTRYEVVKDSVRPASTRYALRPVRADRGLSAGSGQLAIPKPKSGRGCFLIRTSPPGLAALPAVFKILPWHAPDFAHISASDGPWGLRCFATHCRFATETVRVLLAACTRPRRPAINLTGREGRSFDFPAAKAALILAHTLSGGSS